MDWSDKITDRTSIRRTPRVCSESVQRYYCTVTAFKVHNLHERETKKTPILDWTTRRKT